MPVPSPNWTSMLVYVWNWRNTLPSVLAEGTLAARSTGTNEPGFEHRRQVTEMIHPMCCHHPAYNQLRYIVTSIQYCSLFSQYSIQYMTVQLIQLQSTTEHFAHSDTANWMLAWICVVQNTFKKYFNFKLHSEILFQILFSITSEK